MKTCTCCGVLSRAEHIGELCGLCEDFRQQAEVTPAVRASPLGDIEQLRGQVWDELKRSQQTYDEFFSVLMRHTVAPPQESIELINEHFWDLV